MTDKQDLQQAMGEVMEAAERSASLPGHGTRGLPLQTLLTATPLKFQLARCKEVPRSLSSMLTLGCESPAVPIILSRNEPCCGIPSEIEKGFLKRFLVSNPCFGIISNGA